MAFREKPSQETADLLLARRCLWNTLVITCRVQRLWSLAKVYMPEVFCLFERFMEQLPLFSESPIECRRQALLNFNEILPSANLSYTLLNRAARHSLVMPPTGILWNDWGRPERLPQFLESPESRAAV